jgi:predicted metalloendopeptidase
VIAFATAGGLGLPDRDYYVKDDDKSKEIRAQYLRMSRACSSSWAIRPMPRDATPRP